VETLHDLEFDALVSREEAIDPQANLSPVKPPQWPYPSS